MIDQDAGVPNVLEEMRLFSWVGTGCGDEHAYRLFLAMTNLKRDTCLGLKSVRFFGQIQGTSKPYYVIEGVLANPVAGPAFSELGPSHPEPSGTGLNSCVYFVANDVSESFVKLPDVSGPRTLDLRGSHTHHIGIFGAYSH